MNSHCVNPAVLPNRASRLITTEADKTIKIWREDPDATPDTHPIDMQVVPCAGSLPVVAPTGCVLTLTSLCVRFPQAWTKEVRRHKRF